MDNYAGINVGMQIVKEKLPKHLKESYNYDAEKVAAKLEKLQFDWADFDSYACTIEGIGVGDWLKRAR